MRIENDKSFKVLTDYLSEGAEALETKILAYLLKHKFVSSSSNYWGTKLKDILSDKDASSSSHAVYLFGNVPQKVKDAFGEINIYTFTRVVTDTGKTVTAEESTGLISDRLQYSGSDRLIARDTYLDASVPLRTSAVSCRATDNFLALQYRGTANSGIRIYSDAIYTYRPLLPGSSGTPQIGDDDSGKRWDIYANEIYTSSVLGGDNSRLNKWDSTYTNYNAHAADTDIHTPSSDLVAKAGDTMEGKFVLHDGADVAPFNIPSIASEPSGALMNGDIWNESGALKFRTGGASETVLLGDLTDNYIPVWDNANGKLIDSPLSVDGDDVEGAGNITAIGAVVAYSDSDAPPNWWDNLVTEVGDRVDLGDLSNVVITSVSVDDGIKWNGTNWVNSAAIGSSGLLDSENTWTERNIFQGQSSDHSQGLTIGHPDGADADGDADGLSTSGVKIQSLEWRYTDSSYDEKTFARIDTINYNTEGTGWYDVYTRIKTGMDFIVYNESTVEVKALSIDNTGEATFSDVVTVGNATAGGHAVNRTTADSRYGQLAATNTWTEDQTINANLIVGTTAAEKHIEFQRTGANYIVTPSGGSLTLSTTESIGLANSGLSIDSSSNVKARVAMSVGTTDSPTAGYALDVRGKGRFTDNVDIDGTLKCEDGSSYFAANFSTGRSYLTGYDDSGVQKYILRTYASSGIQLLLEAGGIDADGDIISTGKVVAYDDS